ncbi:alpha-1,2-mannosyltransferase [Actinoplanes lutulentus]|uniref:Alpha-1,2-mannosyltransferase n=1 Tax=Actinoplanes lutulentus TaxID=1287878 RepID=A0A327Z940_9ACTN|nr:glycosyltransferase family 87 protein [Actinoplanes lutulentus]MBB2944750.1 alpha-1,2-mannosyltransferase [Actinoplanes lutulentus]RAK35456.1 alpha-1,2-mannosyltransferase [Actinoplanes lutulentus]
MPAIEKGARRAARRRSALLALGGLLTLLLITFCIHGYALSTLEVQLAAIRSWIIGDGLYTYREDGTPFGAALSPVLALMLAPLVVLPLPVAGWLLALTSLAALMLALMVLAGPAAREHGRSRTLIVLTLTALALLAGPVRATIGLGRVDLILFGLVAADLVALRRATLARQRWWRSRSATGDRSPAARLRRVWFTGGWAGVGIGLAGAIAAGPLLLIGYLLVSKQRRAALTALVTATTVSLCALIAAPSETLTWFGTTLWEIDRAAPLSDPGNQSLAGVLARLYGDSAPPVLVWISFGVLLLAVGLIRARSAHADGDETAAFTLVALAGAAAGPVTSPGEAIWLLPAVLILADEAIRRRLGTRLPRSRFTGVGFAATALAGYALMVLDPLAAQTWNGYAVALILLVNALPWRHDNLPAAPARRPVRRAAAIPGPRGG